MFDNVVGEQANFTNGMSQICANSEWKEYVRCLLMVDAIHEIIELKSVLRAAIIVELIAGICPLDDIESIGKGASRYIRK